MESPTTISSEFDLTGKVIIANSMPIFTGNYSTVYQGNFEGETVAVKVIKATGNPASMQRKILRERTICSSLQHQNIHQFYGFANGQAFGPFGALISPWYARGDAYKFMENHGAQMSEKERTDLWSGVVDGVAYLHLHEPVIVHGDLKPGNILIDDSGRPRICDFGLSQLFLEEKDTGFTTTSEHTGTERYLAPELVMSESTVYPTVRSDIYALGCLGLEFIYQKRPYSHRINNLRGQIIRDIRDGTPPAPDPKEPWSHLWLLLRSCWDKSEDSRPSATTVVRFLSTFSAPQTTIVDTTGDRDWHRGNKGKTLQASDHLDLAKAAENLASAYSRHERWNDAEKLLLEALETRLKYQEADHLDTVSTSGKLATTYFWQGRLNEAETLQFKVLQNRTKIQGEKHLDTIVAAGKLAATYHRQERFNDAEKLQLVVLMNRKKVQGAKHLDTIAAARDLAATYYFQQKWSEAEKLESETLKDLTRILGPEHLETVTSAENLASIYFSQERWADAERLQSEVLKNRNKVLGEHPHTIRAAENLNTTCFRQERWGDVEKLQLAIFETRTKVYGVEHLETIKAAENLVMTYFRQEKWNDAERLQLNILQTRRRVYGGEHLGTIQAASDLSTIYGYQGRMQDAQDGLFAVLDKRKRIQGPKHPDTVAVAGKLAAVYWKRNKIYHATKLKMKYNLESMQ
ncbi:hypothetical protein M408DRAFT_29927 [Serendipita vermifera MAFF 305830]|uniref:Protein kinase domain-containing protein n=1 Tax=Serendipita vermifera MAFF 305830 TaxID=933852 RepID=A0A0C3ALM4_SERVB|nr:hypothetical protein M408DRAFT_29927 [Serendipita vermifera MAFF 305830]